MSGTEDFGTGGYGAGDAERAAAEPGPGGSTRNAPPTGPRVHVPSQNPGPHQGAAAAGVPTGTPNGAPWLAAGSVPYAEAMFGAGQDAQQQHQQHQQPQGATNALRAAAERAAAARMPRGAGAGAGAGRRGVPETPGQVQTAGPGYPDPYAPEYGPGGYANGANGYAQHPGQPQQPPAQPQMPQLPQLPQLPQQRYDAAPFDSGFTQQARFAQQAQAQAQGQPPQGGYEQPQQPQQPPADRSSSGFEPGAVYEQAPYQGQPYPAAGPAPAQRRGPGFVDEPTTEFTPGPLFDEPTVRPAAPPPAQAAGTGLNGRGSVFSSRQSAQDPQAPQAPAGTQGPQPPVNGGAPGQPAGTTQRPSMSGSGTWTAAPAPAAQKPPQAAGTAQPGAGSGVQQPAPGQASGAQPGVGVQQPAPGQPSVTQPGASQLGASQPPASVSGIPRVPSQQAAEAVASQSSQSLQTQPPATPAPGSAPLASAAAAPVGAARGEAPQRADSGYANAPMPSRPPLPDEPPPGPPPLPVRPPRAERQAQQPQGAQSAAAQSAAAAQAVAQSVAAQSAVRSAAAAAVRETLTPPRRVSPPPPAEQPPAAAPQQQATDDLTSERMRSVAPNVATPRAVAPEPQPPLAAPPAAAHEQDTHEGDELIVPWQATAAAPSAEAVDDDEDDDVLHGSGSHQPAPAPQQQQPQPQQQPVQQDQAPVITPAQQPQPQAPSQPQAQQAPAAQSAPVATQAPQTSAPTRAEATAAPQATSATTATPAAAQPPAAPPAAAPAASEPDPAEAAAAGPAGTESTAPNVPTPRGTRRRVPEPDADTDPRTYAPTAAPAPDASAPQQPQAQPEPQPQDADPEIDPDHLPTARQPRLHLESVPPSPPQPQQPQSQQPQPSSAPGAPRVAAYEDEALAAVYRVIHERRDVRNDFLSDPVPTDVLTRILQAAHTAPSVGFSQPWDFLVIRDQTMRQRVHELAVRQRRSYAASLPKARARAFAALKIEAILETPINIIVTCDPTRGGRHTLGRYTQPLMAPFSSCLAVENLWLAARAEGLGVGWVSFFDERELAAVLDLPDHLQVVAYLCVGYVKSFPPEPELAGAGWAQRRPLAWAVHEEHYGHRALPGSEPVSLLSETVAAIRGLDPEALGAARDRQARMTKPPGSLGALEALSEQLSGLAGVCPPPMPEPAALAVFAADHGVHAQGVTPWPQEVTAQMVANFLAGGAVVNAFAKQVGAEVCVVDVGVAADLAVQSGLIPRKVRYGTADMTQGPALTREEATAAIEAGIETARDLVAAGNKCLLTGDMGIANTTASAALIAAFTGASPAQVTGYGTGIDEQTYAHKVEVVRSALELHRPDPADPVSVLCAFGGLEHAALAGFILGSAALRIPVVLDGVIAGASALVAQALSPEVTAACVAGHRSAEPGHALALEQLGITPLIDLELRLGEGSGAALALPLVGAAVRALREVATFDDAGVSDASAEAVVPPNPAERERA